MFFLPNLLISHLAGLVGNDVEVAFGAVACSLWIFFASRVKSQRTHPSLLLVASNKNSL